ncbi:biopolymer transport protein ExbD/biopolymer transport protein TolR [Verrucomicrobium sp. GAS474]|uniref:ExbD/TolR family protein n=1 Tax=Verrucomicrobium sp. GAS474 TaxID=1882831 RepID=UPI00087A6ADF|nr:biopolymer transporter ExbD [Verrucomicrobium sp. GAS474]SDU01925.1 biopolymer transport protein ExbD/biopolymer transport protein TolR [Verrucomicrobium sp. GAS474]
MRFRNKPHRTPIINIVSLIDILCIILIFFVVTSIFRREEPQIKLDLPESSQAKASQQTTPEIITVTEDEKVYLGPTLITVAELGPLLKSKRDADPRARFALKSSKKAPFGIVIKVMDAVKIAGIDELPTFTAEPNEANPDASAYPAAAAATP